MNQAVTFWRKDPTPLEKAIWTFLFLGLMSAEVWMMGKDRTKHDSDDRTFRETEQQNFDTTMQHFGELQNTATALIAQLAIEEADKLDQLLREYGELIKEHVNLDAANSMLSTKFNRCCLDFVRDLHSEILLRAPTSKDENIENKFELIVGEPQWGRLEEPLREYSIWLRSTGIQLKSQVRRNGRAFPAANPPAGVKGSGKEQK